MSSRDSINYLFKSIIPFLIKNPYKLLSKNVKLSVKLVAIRSYPVPQLILVCLQVELDKRSRFYELIFSKHPELCRSKIQKPLKNFKFLEKPLAIRSYPVPTEPRLTPSRTRWVLSITFSKAFPLCRSKIQKPLKNIKLIEKLLAIRPCLVPTQLKLLPSRTRSALEIPSITFSKPFPLRWSKTQKFKVFQRFLGFWPAKFGVVLKK